MRNEDDLHILYKLTWFASVSDVSYEVDTGRGSVDFKVSYGSQDKALVEFKLASNPQLRKNLQHQLELYKKASGTDIGFKVILFFTEAQQNLRSYHIIPHYFELASKGAPYLEELDTALAEVNVI